MELHLDDTQASELQELLASALGEFSSEIADTDNPAFQRKLRDRRHQLQTILQQIDSHQVV
jgi:hypothetical protein